MQSSELAPLIAFDLDGTLTESKVAITPEMAGLLLLLCKKTKVIIISGASFETFKKQLALLLNTPGTDFSNLYLLPVDGSQRFEYDKASKSWKITDKQTFPAELKKTATSALNEIIASTVFDIPHDHLGEYVEDRDTQITFSALGQNADLARKKAWDPDQKKRQAIKAELERRIPGLSVTVSGTTSIDILPKGFNKASGLELFLKKFGMDKKDMHFVGDAIFPGGNDYPAFEAGIESTKVSGPEETKKIIQGWVGEGIETKNMIEAPPQKKSDEKTIAYFCSEYALDDDSKMYAGGLGILAGDYMLELAHHDIPFVALGLKYGETIPDGFSTLSINNEAVIIRIPIGQEIISAKVWHRALSASTNMYLLDTYINENKPENKTITSNLYDAHFYTRVKQQIVLGIGGCKILEKLNINPAIYHLNEGHAAFGGVGVMVERPQDIKKIVATKHTILSEAGLHVSKKDFEDLLGVYCKENSANIMDVFEKGKYELDPDIFSTTKFLMTISQRKNGVSVLHTVFEKKRHANSELIPITNGIYTRRWQAPDFLARSKTISDEELMNIKKKLRAELFSYVRTVSGKRLNDQICTLVWARRFAAYKRPHLLFSDEKRLLEIISNQNFPLQIVISGKAHPADEEGQAIVRQIIEFSNDPRVKDRIVYLPDYSISVARELVQGADIWLNTPERGKEACGTSGMKAASNGALQCSISDGWVDEENWQGRGWILPEEKTAETLYDILEHEILPCFYGVKDWMPRMRSTIDLIEKTYTTERMLNEYMKKLYML